MYYATHSTKNIQLFWISGWNGGLGGGFGWCLVLQIEIRILQNHLMLAWVLNLSISLNVL